MLEDYNKLLRSDVYGAIKLRAGELWEKYDNYGAIYDALYYGKYISDEFLEQNLESILIQLETIPSDQDYDLLIRVLEQTIKKYDMTLNYSQYQESPFRLVKFKWEGFVNMFTRVLSRTDDNVEIKLLKSGVIREYLSAFHKFFTYREHFRSFKDERLEALLEIPCYQSGMSMLHKLPFKELISKNSSLRGTLPFMITGHPCFAKEIAANLDSEEYCAVLESLESYNYNAGKVDELHDKFCDNVMKTFDFKEQCFPFIKEEDFLSEVGFHKPLSKAYRALEAENKTTLNQDFSKYLITGFIFSKYFKASMHNLSIDMKSLIDYVTLPSRNIKFDFPNKEIYEKLVDYKNTDVMDLVALYELFKQKNIRDEFYDDWHKAQSEFVDELNSKTLNANNLGEYNESLTTALGVSVYELKGQDYYMILRNTSANPSREDIRSKLAGSRSYLSLSVHDQNHFKCYEKENKWNYNSSDLKLIFGEFDEKNIGMIYHSDIYSQGISRIEIGSDATRELHSLRSLMENTKYYNEITHAKTDALKPIAILCENEIIPEQIKAAKELGLPIVLRHNSKYIQHESKSKQSKIKNTYIRF